MGGEPKAAPQETPFWEKAVGVVGLLIVLGVVGFLLYEALQPQTAADIVAEVKAVTPQAGGYLVDFDGCQSRAADGGVGHHRGGAVRPGAGRGARGDGRGDV